MRALAPDQSVGAAGRASAIEPGGSDSVRSGPGGRERDSSAIAAEPNERGDRTVRSVMTT